MEGRVKKRKVSRSKFLRHVRLLIWKSAVQRRRRWLNVTLQSIFAGVLFLLAVFTAKPVFLTPLDPNPGQPLTYTDIIQTLGGDTLLGFAPNEDPFIAIMNRVSQRLHRTFITGKDEEELNHKLYINNRASDSKIRNHVIWVIWKPKYENVWKFTIRCTELAEMAATANASLVRNRHLRAGFLAVQLAISEVLLRDSSVQPMRHEISLVAMPMSPLMREETVRNAMAWILLFYTFAFIPPVMEISYLVVKETSSRYKRALRMRDVDYSSMYIGWLVYAFLTAMPNCVLASLALIVIFRWILLFHAAIFVFTYICVTIMLALIMAMFHSNPLLACIWSALLTLLQLFLAELLVHHGFIGLDSTFILHIILPPLGLVHGLNSFALLQTGCGDLKGNQQTEAQHTPYTISLWLFMIGFYFGVLMLLQRTIGQERAIGGQVPWKSIIFKKAENKDKLRVIHNLSGKEREKLQEVDEFVAKAISFRQVSKSIMGVQVLHNVTFDIYRGEYTMFFAERIQDRLLNTVEDLVSGLSYPDRGSINVLGHHLTEGGRSLVTQRGMVGCCHTSQVLVEEFTVIEQIQFFLEISLWGQSMDDISEFFLVQMPRVLQECNLEEVQQEYVRDLGLYYRAQLCWAIAVMLEPRIIHLSHFKDGPEFIAVINDKILKARNHITILKMCHSTRALEQADRLFIFDGKTLAFGGTPAYMFFKFGRDYRVRLMLRNPGLDDTNTTLLLRRAAEFGASVRAHLGSLLILRLPTSPTARATQLLRDLTDNCALYGITTLHISLPDSEEICRRAIEASRSEVNDQPEYYEVRQAALRRIAQPRPWKRNKSCFVDWACFRQIAWKYISFYIHYRFFLIITIISAMMTGSIIGMSLSVQLKTMADRMSNKTSMHKHGEKMTVEALPLQTELIVRADNTPDCIEVASAYVLSHTNATQAEVDHISYVGLPNAESTSEYLILRAIDSPQQYVYMYAYGMTVHSSEGRIWLRALYSPIHQDGAAAARSLSRVYTALLRYYTGLFDADIEVTDDPLGLDSSALLETSTISPLIIQFMLVMTMSHITLLPSKEYGLVRHMQAHAANFSPAQYWLFLFFCDLILFWMLVFVVASALICVMYIIVTRKLHFMSKDLLVVPFVLIIYGLSSVPQAYLFSLGPRPHLNTMTFIIFNIVFGEATVLSNILYGSAFDLASRFLSLSPQYNVANAFIRMTQIFVYNSECILFNNTNLCASNMLHKCCEKCGIMQPCFKRISYLSRLGILDELVATVASGGIFLVLLITWEYKVIQRVLIRAFSRFVYRANDGVLAGACSPPRQLSQVVMKREQMKHVKKKDRKFYTFGGYLLAHNVSLREDGFYIVKNVSLGVARGQVLAISGLKRHGRLRLCEILAGYRMAHAGAIYAMSKWRLSYNPHKYSRNVGLCCFDNMPLPPWMTVFDALTLIAVLRGVPPKYVKDEVKDYIDALELHDKADTDVRRLPLTEMTRVNFATVAVGAPPILVIDECTAYQKPSVSRAMYFILHQLKNREHGIIICSAGVESHMPVTNNLAIMLDGGIYDTDNIDSMVERSQRGYTVVVHLKDEVDAQAMFSKYFKKFIINDTADVLVNVQVLDPLDYADIFERMEKLLKENDRVYTYIVAAIPMDYIYNRILGQSEGLLPADSVIKSPCWKYVTNQKRKVILPSETDLTSLETFGQKYDITTLKQLPWSVIFQR